jgi:hypothetical protein
VSKASLSVLVKVAFSDVTRSWPIFSSSVIRPSVCCTQAAAFASIFGVAGCADVMATTHTATTRTRKQEAARPAD